MTRGEWAWVVLAGGIIAYEATCEPEELLSAAADGWIEKHPVLARLGIVTVGTLLTIHVGNLVPQPSVYDPVSMGFWQRLLHS